MHMHIQHFTRITTPLSRSQVWEQQKWLKRPQVIVARYSIHHRLQAPPPLCDDNTDFLNTLNTLFSQFEVNNITTAMKATPNSHWLNTADIWRTLHRVNPRKAPGPDNIPGCIIRQCADQLIYINPLKQAIIPQCLKSTSITSLPKKSPVSKLDDYFPIVPTPIVMKCFEKLFKNHVTSRLSAMFDPHQFTYCPNSPWWCHISSTSSDTGPSGEQGQLCADAFYWL